MTGGDKPSPPRDEPEIAALFAGWRAYRRIALAVSGGADSMALMRLACDWRARIPSPPEFLVLTVDHGLRAESADEAAWVKQRAASLDLHHETLRWTGPKPTSDLQAAARAARYALMLACCREAGVAALATAHNADDQAETLLMRLARGSGLDGLAGIPPLAMRDGIALLRPLLGVTRARLEAHLHARGQDWIEDPSNRDSRHERVRIREAMRAGRALQLGPETLALSARRLNRARLALDTYTQAVLHTALDVYPAGYGEISLSALTDAPAEIGIRAIALMAAMFGGGARPVRLARIEALLDALAAGDSRAATLGGCVFSVRRGRLRAAREYGRIDPARMTLPAEGVAVWDGRFAITAQAGEGLAIGALGEGGVALLRAMGGGVVHPSGWRGRATFEKNDAKQRDNAAAHMPRERAGTRALPAAIAYSLPALWRGDDLLFAPFAAFAGALPEGWFTGIGVRFIGA